MTGNNGIKVLAAAYVALNHGGEGSSPSDPTEQHNESTVRLTERYLRRNEVMRVRFSHGALIFDNLASQPAPMV